MARLLGALLIAGVAWSGSLSAGQCVPPAFSQTLKAGDAAPDFQLAGSDGRTYRLSEYRGKQAVVLVWFARAFSDG